MAFWENVYFFCEHSDQDLDSPNVFHYFYCSSLMVARIELSDIKILQAFTS